MTEAEVHEFISSYVAAWKSREPGVMRSLWHEDGLLHHPSLREPIGADLVPFNNDNTKRLQDFDWNLESWAANGNTVFLQWRMSGSINGRKIELCGVDRFRLVQGKIIEEVVYFDTMELWEVVDPSAKRPPLVDKRALEQARGG